jgi:hypothetical protein
MAALHASPTLIQNHVSVERPKNSPPQELPDPVSPACATISQNPERDTEKIDKKPVN